MPLEQCQVDGQPGWRWGSSGKCYTYRPGIPLSEAEAKAKAMKQARAVESSKAAEAESK